MKEVWKTKEEATPKSEKPARKNMDSSVRWRNLITIMKREPSREREKELILNHLFGLIS